MAEVLLDNVDLTVFGGPTTLDVSVDVGDQGVRGSKIWAGPGNPDIYTTESELLINDLYVNTATTGSFPGWLYQYILAPGGPEWTPILLLNPSQFSAISSTTFTTGSATINIPVSSLTTANVTDVTKFIVRLNVENANAVASAFTYSLTGTHPNKNIAIVVKGASWNGTTWSNLTGAQNVHLFISYIG